MGTTADKLNKLITTKTDIKTAIVEKGVEVLDNDTFASYADKIRSIQTGGNIPSPFVDIVDLYKKTKAATGYSLSWRDDIFGYDSSEFPVSEIDSYRFYMYANFLLDCLISNSKKNITIFSDDIIDSSKLSSYVSHYYDIFEKNVDSRDTSDISGDLGYYDLDNSYYVYFNGTTFSSQYLKIFKLQNFTKVKIPKIYAPKCARYLVSGRNYDYSEGFFYMPNGRPYEITPDAVNFYNDDVFQSTIYPSGKMLSYTFSCDNTMNPDLLVEQLPINSTGYTGRITYTTSLGAPALTEAQKNKIVEKGWKI